MIAYYNENDSYCAAWLRNLMAAGQIPDGEVDSRSIVDVRPSDLAGFSQCHFFAGIAGWAYALRLAGWDDRRVVWTGSCPCQPFSAAGQRGGSSDSRHLWPEFRRLIAECRPAVVFGEQVASAGGRDWLAVVRADLEGMAYAVGAADLCAAGAGAPHIRQRLYWVADADRSISELTTRTGTRPSEAEGARALGQPERCGDAGRLGDPGSEGLARRPCQSGDDGSKLPALERAGCEPVGLEYTESDRRIERRAESGGRGAVARRGLGGMANPDGGNPSPEWEQPSGQHRQQPQDSRSGAWSDIEWLPCKDGRLRPTKPQIFPLAHGIFGRVAQLRAIGNAIIPQVAAEFIAAFMDCRP